MGFLFEFLTNIVYIACFVFVGELFFEFVRKNSKYEKLFITLFVFFITAISFYVEIWSEMLIHFACIFAILFICFREKMKILLSFYFGMTITLSMLSMMLEMIFSEIIDNNLVDIDENQIDFMIIILLFISIWMMGNYFTKRYPGSLRKIGTKYWILFIIVLFIDSTIVLLLGDYVINTLQASRKYVFMFFYCFIVVGILIQLVLLINTLVTRNVHKENEALAKQFLDNQNEHYLYLEKREYETKKFRHDIKNHLLLLENFVTNNENEKAKEYLATLNEKVNAFSNHVSVNNGIADAVFNKFYEEAQEKGVELKVSGHFPQACYISAYDICTVLSNLLSNAVLAASDSDERKVWVDIRHTSDELLLVVENEFNHKLQVQNSTYLSTKMDSFGHGYGLSNVKECVERNEGHMSISTENHRFKVMLSMKNEKEENA